MDQKEYARRVADAVADVIEQERWAARIGSVRQLAERAGMTHTALNARMSKKTTYNVRDLAQLAPVLNTTPAAILEKARTLVEGVDELAARRAGNRDLSHLYDEESAAEPVRRDIPGEDADPETP